MYIEYLGIPGSGKTYHAAKYKKLLKEEGKNFLDVSRQKDMSLWLKVFYKLAENVLLLFPKYRKQAKEYENICRDCLDKPNYLPFTLSYCIKDIVLASLLHDVFDSKNRIFLNDEGQLQRIVFLVVQYDVPLDEILSVYNKYKGNVKTLYVKTDVVTALANIKNRNRHVCPMDEMDDKTLMLYITSFYHACESCYNTIK